MLPRSRSPRVEVFLAQPAPLELVVRAPGVLRPERFVVVKAEFEGPVVRKLYQAGDAVQKGHILVEIGRDQIQGSFMARANEFKNAKAELLHAEKEVRLQKTLFRKGAVAEGAIGDAQRALERARQQLDVSSAVFRLESLRWEKNLFSAPFDGTVLKDSLGEEKNTQAGKELLSLGDLSSHVMVLNVDEIDIGQVKVGQRAVVRLQAIEGSAFSAKVASIGSMAEDKGMIYYPVKLALDSSEGLPPMPQFTGEGRIMTGSIGPVLSVPLAAVATAEGRRVLWVVGGLGRLQARAVELGRSNPERVEITSGLAAGQRVVAKADSNLSEGMRVLQRE